MAGTARLAALAAISYITTEDRNSLSGLMMEMTNLDIPTDDDAPRGESKPHTLTVLALLIVAAATFSYLGAFAITDALVRANVIRPFSHNPDPRPLWAMTGFACAMTAFLIIAMVMRYLSWRQFRRIDRMGEGEDN